MSEDLPDLEPIDVAREFPAVSTAPAGGGGGDWPSGWYADPWTAGQYRFWNGQAWTGETHRSGPAAAPAAPGSPTTVTGAWPSVPTTVGAGPPPTRSFSVGTAPGPPSFTRPPRSGRTAAAVAGLVVIVLVAGVVGYALENRSKNDAANKPSTSTQPAPPANSTPSPAPAPAPSDSVRAALSSVVVQQADVGSTRVVVLIPNGNRLTEPTLDLCNGTFASEKLRVARLQVAEVDPTDNAVLSTEAVVYKNAAATTTAFAELRKISAACPHKVIPSPVGEGKAETVFNAAPDSSWPQTPSVDRQAYSFVTTESGTKTSSIAVYLRRGRMLLGIYFAKPSGAQPAVAGKTSIKDIVGVFAGRMAALPASVVNGS